jgi:uncharacterized membrane-anchored protein
LGDALRDLGVGQIIVTAGDCAVVRKVTERAKGIVDNDSQIRAKGLDPGAEQDTRTGIATRVMAALTTGERDPQRLKAVALNRMA